MADIKTLKEAEEEVVDSFRCTTSGSTNTSTLSISEKPPSVSRGTEDRRQTHQGMPVPSLA